MPYRAPAVADELIVTPDKQMAMIGIGGSFALRDDDADFPAMHMVDFLFGGSPSSRLFERLRQKDGLSYGAGSMLDADAFDKNSLVPGVRHLRAAERAQGDGGDDGGAQLARAEGRGGQGAHRRQADVQGAVRHHAGQRRRGGGLLEESLNVGRKLDYYDKLMSSVQALTAPQIAAAVAKYVKPDALVKVKAGDIKSAAPLNN